MKTLRILYHIARADFLERIRRYSFLMMLGLVIWLGYLSASGQFRMRVPPNYTGVINSAWVGATMAVTATLLLGWVGFYIVKGSINRDYTTGVGQIMATTPLSRPLYLLGKWLSNFAVLGITIIIMMLEGVVMNLLVGVEGFDIVALVIPLAVIALPCMGLIAALAVLFESIAWLRGGLGNIIYFFLFLLAFFASMELGSVGVPGKTANLFIDFSGWQIISNSISHAAQAAYPMASNGFAFSITDLPATNLFHWDGIAWTADMLLSRLFFLLVAIGMVMLSAVFFDRFNPARQRLRKQSLAESITPESNATQAVIPISSVHLTPLANPQTRFRFGALFIAELKLFLKGQGWWWYTIAAGLIGAQLFADLEVSRFLLIIAWVWLVLILSRSGCRETLFDTRQIVFSAPRPLINQLTAAWLCASAVTALMGSGAMLRFLFAGETTSILGWLTAVIFIPSLALATGVLTGSSKAFEVIYIFWMYMLTQKAPLFDFAGMTPEAPLYIYALLAFGLIAITIFARDRQLKSR